MKKVFYLIALVFGLALTACGGDDEPELKFEDVTLQYEQTYTIPNGKNTTWSSSNELIASVEGTTVTANKVGEAIISSDKGSFRVTVTPTLHVFVEPCLQWGANVNTVKSFMASKLSSLTLSKETEDALTYSSSATKVYTYVFEAGQLTSSAVGLNSDYVSSEAMADFMIERYVPVTMDQSSNTFYFISPDKKNVIMFAITSSGRTIIYLVAYAKYTPSRSVDISPEIFKGIKMVQSPNAASEFNKIKSQFRF